MTAARRVRINRLVLAGVDERHRAAVVTAFRGELIRLLAEYPDSIPPPQQVCRGTDTPVDIGRRTAAAVHAKVVGAC